MEREVRVRRSEKHMESVQIWRWVLVLSVGLAMGLISFALNQAASALTLLRFRLTDTLIQRTGEHPPASFSHVAPCCASSVGHASPCAVR